jgi:hypothetical protein
VEGGGREGGYVLYATHRPVEVTKELKIFKNVDEMVGEDGSSLLVQRSVPEMVTGMDRLEEKVRRRCRVTCAHKVG